MKATALPRIAAIAKAALRPQPRPARPRKMRPLLTFSLIVWMVTAAGLTVAHADQTTPIGFGSLIPMPSDFPGGLSLFEWTSQNGGPGVFTVDDDLGRIDVGYSLMNGISVMIWQFAVLAVYTVIALAYWLLSFTGATVATDALASVIGASASEMMSWLAPSAVVIGLLISWVRHRSSDAITAITWTLLAAVFGMSLALFPRVWVDGTNNIRSIGSEVVMSSMASAVSPNDKSPFPWTSTTYGGGGGGEPQCDPRTGKCTITEDRRTPEQKQNTMLRKTSDAVWRGLVATPWCIVEFGSLEACELYGQEMIKKGPDREARKKYINDVIKKQEGGDDAPTVRWVKGYMWAERLGATVVSLVVVIIFSIALLVLGMASLRAVVDAIFHLIVGVPFALMWCIEGRPRRWGMNWLQSLVGTIIQGIVALLTFSATLVFLTVCWAMSATWGWFGAIGFSLVGAVAAFRFRQVVASFFDITLGGHAGAMVAGAMAVRMLTRAMGSRGGGGARSAGHGAARQLPSPRDRGTGRTSHSDRTTTPGPPTRTPPRRNPNSTPPRRPSTVGAGPEQSPRPPSRDTGPTSTRETKPFSGPPPARSAASNPWRQQQAEVRARNANQASTANRTSGSTRTPQSSETRGRPPARRAGGTPSRRAAQHTTTGPARRQAPQRAPQPARSATTWPARETPPVDPFARWRPQQNPPQPRRRQP